MMTKQYIKSGKYATEHWVIHDRVFNIAGTRFEVIGSAITGNGPNDVNHFIKGPGGVKEMTHKQLIAVWLKHGK